ncbi:aminoglycoside phosphotransferase family protein [Chryseomicrobium sp. FSL W7-1435]|uniref:phosphotransferase family protein n=1 Tax=Chryseomicrobium sp. FSL W7-1435 TaxID=2921704 RepID=UPI003159D708
MDRTQLEKQFGLKFETVQDVPDSFSSTVYKCKLMNGEEVYLKIPFSKVKFDRERDAYKVLAGHVEIPKLLEVWEEDEDMPGAFLLSALPGQTLTGTPSRKLGYEVGVYHARLHEVQPGNPPVDGIDNEFSNWRDFVDRMFYGFAEDTKELISPQALEQSLKKYEQMKSDLPPLDGPSFLHMDFRPANIVVQGNAVTGSIDFESVRFGATEIDFTKLYRDYLQHDENVFEAYQQGYRSVRPLIDLEAVLPYYRFTDAFNSIGWCQRRGIEKNRAFLEQNQQLLLKFLR